jgi:hypothetical protein
MLERKWDQIVRHLSMKYLLWFIQAIAMLFLFWILVEKAELHPTLSMLFVLFFGIGLEGAFRQMKK